ncbi:hypothetical protein TH63_15535 [Rufibacter radiotolerans]|uniref:Protein-glutamine gamma-glutamyltransferase-like C-terminal domain-containing protein n=1 Tax=Rufibacter radiotolerans TaxID=1379910 RepID=A0A0H4VN21_9BACT|nr:hypothetical protein TH63_15535 [Rufibacter radiotolerans]
MTFVRFSFPLFFLMLVLSGSLWAGTAVAAPAQTVTTTPAPLQLRYPDAAKLKELRESRDFQYQQDLRPDLSFWQRWLQRIGQFINRVLEARSFQSFWKYVIYAFAIGITLYVVLKLFKVDFVGLFSRKAPAAAIAFETYRENIHEIDFKALIEEAEAQGDYRRAIRLHYLSTLKILTDQELIQWNPGKTNRSYVSELRNPALRRPFEHITQLFEYVWYGGSALSEQRFQVVRQAFQEFNRSLPVAA